MLHKILQVSFQALEYLIELLGIHTSPTAHLILNVLLTWIRLTFLIYQIQTVCIAVTLQLIRSHKVAKASSCINTNHTYNDSIYYSLLFHYGWLV